MTAALAIAGCDGLEFDVRRSSDGIPVVIHDETLERVQGSPDRVDALPAAVLETHGIPRLVDLLAAVDRRAFLDVELKGTHDRAVVEVLAAARGADLRDTVVSSFEPATLERVRGLAPAWPRWLNSQTLDADVVATAAQLDCRGVSVWFEAIDDATMAMARAAGLEVAAWTVRRRADLRPAGPPRGGRRVRGGRGARRLTHRRTAHDAARDGRGRTGRILAAEARTEESDMTDRADLVVVGAGTVGGWASVFARADGLGRVVVVERGLAGMGASSRAAGIVRAQGGTPATVALGRWTIDFYNGQAGGLRHGLGLPRARLPDPRGHRGGRAGRPRARRDAAGERARRPLAGRRRGGRRPPSRCHRTAIAAAASSRPTGAIDPPRNVRAYSLAMQAAGVELRERTAFTGPADGADPGRRSRVAAVETDARRHRDRARPADRRPDPPRRRRGWPACGSRPARPATRSPSSSRTPPSTVERMPMVFDIGAGLYWRLEEGGLLFGWSDPDESPGEARRIDWAFYERMREPAGRVRPGHARARPAPDLGRHDRLHARPPADPRPGARRRRARRSRA